MPATSESDPTREECVKAFWDIIGPGLVDLMRAGKIDIEKYRRIVPQSESTNVTK